VSRAGRMPASIDGAPRRARAGIPRVPMELPPPAPGVGRPADSGGTGGGAVLHETRMQIAWPGHTASRPRGRSRDRSPDRTLHNVSYATLIRRGRRGSGPRFSGLRALPRRALPGLLLLPSVLFSSPQPAEAEAPGSAPVWGYLDNGMG